MAIDKLLLRVIGWTEQVADKAVLCLKSKCNPARVEVSAKAVGIFGGMDEGRGEESNWPSSTESGADWERFKFWQDGLVKRIAKSCVRTGKGNEVVVLLLDDIPERIIPLVCFAWHGYVIQAYREQGEQFESTLPLHLAVLSESAKKQFYLGCANPDVLFQQLERLQSFSLEAPLLLSGPTGTGKSFFAKFLHKMLVNDAKSVSNSFERVNLAELSDDSTTFTSRLVGHVKGSFTGASTSHDGVLRSNQNGTVFFDELDGLSIPNQIRLLTFTDDVDGDGQLHQRRFGESKVEPFKRCKMIFATNRDIGQAVHEGRLRPDFLFRFRDTVVFPGLQEYFKGENKITEVERNSRILAFVSFFLMRLRPSLENEKTGFVALPFRKNMWSKELFRKMADFHWSGNFRTMEKFCRHLLAKNAFSDANIHAGSQEGGFDLEKVWDSWAGEQYDALALPQNPVAYSNPSGRKIALPRNAPGLSEEIVKKYKEMLLIALEASKENGRYNLARAAKSLGIDARTLGKQLRAFSIDTDRG